MKIFMNKRWLMWLMAVMCAVTFTACGGTTEKTEETDTQAELATEIAQGDWKEAKQSVELSTGINMKYVEMGQKDGEPLIFIHGMTDNSRSWSLIAPYFTDKYHVYMMDLRGHGDTDKPDMRIYDSALYAADIAAFMDKMGIEKAKIVGHSLGSMITQTLAINYPEKVDKIVLESTAPIKPSELSTYLYETAQSFDKEGPTEEFMNMWYENPNPVDKKFLSYEMKESQKLPVYDWLQICKGFCYADSTLLMPELKADTLILWGSADGFFDEAAQNEIKSLIPHAEFIAYEGNGHNIQWEIPEKMAQDVLAFFNK
ncbi:MAG: alpha/beta hydrolase [Clostridiales bacterium]